MPCRDPLATDPHQQKSPILCRHSGGRAGFMARQPGIGVFPEANRLTRAILGARAARCLRRSRLQSCKRSRVPPANNASGPGMTTVWSMRASDVAYLLR
jgi:hypothetical protein